ncbi:pecanex-like protein 1 isoform X1 [Halyomorpha halys]|uniref:pecanex-like protein 1 isoform X1 n=1 Tax=Halyomorpha halys TaxID=286706 RepID=UPI0006D4E459|nr:pecanex-like protein 1 isoform X1 [Halyomorpha halys]
MGSQTLEILRQGVWASFTGGWYYDPHQSIFCNTFHLYLWLFLLCLPFSIYLYLPPSIVYWGGYCTSVAILFTIIKLINFSLHRMFDKPECVVEEQIDDKDLRKHQPHHTSTPLNPPREEEGIEMQVLNTKRLSIAGTSATPECSPPASSVTDSNDIAAQHLASTIDLKVDVHRKNSSESSDGLCSCNLRKDSVASTSWMNAGSSRSLSQVSLHRDLSGAMSLCAGIGILEGAEGGDLFAEDRRFHHRHKKRRGRQRLSSRRARLPRSSVDEEYDGETLSPSGLDWLFHNTDSENERHHHYESRHFGLWSYTFSDDTLSDTSLSLLDQPPPEEEEDGELPPPQLKTPPQEQCIISKTLSTPVVGCTLSERHRIRRGRLKHRPRQALALVPRHSSGASGESSKPDDVNNNNNKKNELSCLLPAQPSAPPSRLSPVLPVVPGSSSAALSTLHQLTQAPGGGFILQSLAPRVSSQPITLFSPQQQTPHESHLEVPQAPSRSVIHFMDSVESPKAPRRYYRYSWCPYIKVRFDRLTLLAVLDRDLSYAETWFSILLASSVSILGSYILYLQLYKDLQAFILCFVMAGSQYSLLKSVQPDTASPTHGYNRIVVFSRPVYFVIVASLILIFHLNMPKSSVPVTIYGLSFRMSNVSVLLRDFLLIFLLCFPLLFGLGLYPQINTFAMHLLEQIDMHVFGGNATCSLWSAVYCVFRSVVAVLFLYGFAYGGLSEEKTSQRILFSIYCGLLVATSYHLSRSSSEPGPILNILKAHIWVVDEEIPKVEEAKEDPEEDPLPRKLQETVNTRLKSDLLVCTVIALVVFGIHCSSVFTALQPELNPVIGSVAIAMGFILHYVIPQLRKQLPWLCLARPVLRHSHQSHFEPHHPPAVMWFEKLFVWLCTVESNIVYPVLMLARLSSDSAVLSEMFGPAIASLIISITSLKLLRSSFSQPDDQYLILTFAVLFFQVDYPTIGHTFLIDYFITAIVYNKTYEFLLKVQFVVTYIAPWQITWGSAFHAFAQPFSVPHSAMTFLQAGLSAVVSAPLNPFLGSAIFLSSYVRPVKFWERDYNTRRVDHSNTRLCSHLDRNLGADDNNLNSIFYEHLTHSLQHSLCGDIILGRWGIVRQGDCFVLASDYLNCLVHIIEIGNGLITFQMRGLEFRGTYCQQREVEAISEGVEENQGWCCCEPGHLPHLLSLNASFSLRWLAWQVTAASYILEGYSISDNSAISMLQVFDFRKVLVTYYVKSIIYYAVGSERLETWLESSVILEALRPTLDKNFIELDPVFTPNIDEDYDLRIRGINRDSFTAAYLDWIQFCNDKREKKLRDVGKDSTLVSLCFALSILGRRTLGAASHNTISSVEFFLYGLHALFKGDFRITSPRDEWIFSDMELLKSVVAPAVRMSLKLHQDHFMSPDEYDDPATLHAAITEHRQKLVISHEGDPVWRAAVLAGTPSLLALRHVTDDGADEYKIIMLNKRLLSFRVIKLNRECVRGLWAGQQQELVYLRNTNPERGSIQNAKQALRNIINSSCDQPIGYPIFVSPLTTSYSDTNAQLRSILPGPITTTSIKKAVIKLWTRVRKRCVEGCSSGGSMHQDDSWFGNEGVYAMTTYANRQSGGISGSLERGGARASMASSGKPSLGSFAGLLSPQTTQGTEPPPLHRVRIVDPNQVYDCINLGRRIDVVWPDERMRGQGGRSSWGDWVPLPGMEGQVVHKWVPCHREITKRSHVDRTILLVKIDERYVPIAESGVIDLGPDL